jgi:hypothetical protein
MDDVKETLGTEASDVKETPPETEKSSTTDNATANSETKTAPSQEGKRGKGEIAKDYGIEAEEEAEDDRDVDWKKRYADSQRNYQQEIQPKLKTLEYWDNLLAANPALAAQVKALAQQQNVNPNSTDVNQKLVQDVETIKQQVQSFSYQQRKEELDKRKEILAKFDETVGKTLTPEQKTKVGVTANRLYLTGREGDKDPQLVASYAEALEKAAQIHNPQLLVEKGKSEAYLSQFKTNMASFHNQASENAGKAAKEPESFDDLNPQAMKWLEMAGHDYKKKAIQRRMENKK